MRESTDLPLKIITAMVITPIAVYTLLVSPLNPLNRKRAEPIPAAAPAKTKPDSAYEILAWNAYAAGFKEGLTLLSKYRDHVKTGSPNPFSTETGGITEENVISTIKSNYVVWRLSMTNPAPVAVNFQTQP